MRCPTGGRDDDLEPAFRRRLGIGNGAVGRAVRRDDLAFVGDAERLENLGGGL